MFLCVSETEIDKVRLKINPIYVLKGTVAFSVAPKHKSSFQNRKFAHLTFTIIGSEASRFWYATAFRYESQSSG